MEYLLTEDNKRKLFRLQALLEDIIDTINILLSDEAVKKLEEAEEDLKGK